MKSEFGWEISHIQIQGAGAQILFRPLPFGLRLAYIPKGPLGDWLPKLLPSIDGLCKIKRAFVLKIEPDAPFLPDLDARLRAAGFFPSPQPIQPARTLVVDLKGDEDHILARMQQKTRYNIRLASRKGVSVRSWGDLAAFSHMIRETAVRDGFACHSAAYYRRAYELFHPSGACELLMAEYHGLPLAALMVFARGPRAWYLYGASTSQERNRMPNYLLQWEAMRWAKGRGCRTYDLWGVPDADRDILEAGFSSRRDGLWGVYRFKRGFGGELVRSAGAWDRPYNAPLYRIYRLLAARRTDG